LMARRGSSSEQGHVKARHTDSMPTFLNLRPCPSDERVGRIADRLRSVLNLQSSVTRLPTRPCRPARATLQANLVHRQQMIRAASTSTPIKNARAQAGERCRRYPASRCLSK
jgi:hypothetical protein